jgi:predicted DCC family thiol-disulfide oxidoreductase YuxK
VHEQQGRRPTRTVPWLIFDGDCAFCTTSVTWVAERLHRRDAPDALLVPWQVINLAALGTTEERARYEVLWVEPDGRIEGGAAAFAAWLRFRGGPYAALGRTMAAPGVRSVAARSYRFVARRRNRMPGGTPACALPAAAAQAGSAPTAQPGS